MFTPRFSINTSKVNNAVKYSEDFQISPCRFAHVKLEDNEVFILHKPVLCRDFLLDTFLWTNGHTEPTKIFGYDFCGDYDNNFYYIDSLPYAENIDFLWEIEDKYKIPRTDIFKCTKGCLLRVSDEWTNSTLRLSLWTWLVRNFLYPDKPNFSLDNGKDITEKLDELMSLPHFPHVVKKEWLHDSYIYHFYNGFMSYLNPASRRYTNYGNI